MLRILDSLLSGLNIIIIINGEIDLFLFWFIF